MNKSDLIHEVYQKLPHTHLIKDLDFESKHKAIRFTWRGDRFQVRPKSNVEGFFVETVGNGILKGDNKSILLQALLNE